MPKTSNLYKYSSATQGFILWGCWAFYVNSKLSVSSGITAGLVQGTFSFVSTLIVISLLTKLFNYFHRPLLKRIIPTLTMIVSLTVLSVCAHTIAHTPEIIKTIAPSLVVATLFCSFTTYKLTRLITD